MAMAIAIPRYTVDDLEHFPDDGNRYELLEGVLLVTPAPSVSHEVVVSRLVGGIVSHVNTSHEALVVTHGAVIRPPGTQLEPDLIVFPARYASAEKWQDIDERWLVVEVLSRSSRIYDREFKRNAYLALGVREVWLVDRSARTVEVCRTPGEVVTVRDVLRWQPPEIARTVEIRLDELFHGMSTA